MAKLTEQEIQYIRRHLDPGKLLPEKYRFLLLEGKHEIIRVQNPATGAWTGNAYLKTNGRVWAPKETARWN